ncbi:MAG TPA: YicC/YloC family endoribonuclease [Steroidobacteraceae bacterium]|nr:YicC/YloC family endoribonuclease [Steroidobacteraceae bacterium]
MIASMTGFARRETSGPWGSLICELRSVNHRFLESSLRLPEELRSLDPEIRQQFGRGLKRGKVDCTLTYRRTDTAARALDLDRGILEQLLGRVREVTALAGTTPVSLDALEALRWPGVIRETDTGTEDLLAAAKALSAATIDDLVQARAREGARLGQLIEQRCAALLVLVGQVRNRLPEVRARIRARLDERLAELAVEVDQDRLEQELALLLQRLDVDEELDRLGAHIAEIRRIIGGNEPAGRRLDFLMQELNREANTLSSKSQDLDTTRAAVDMKVLIEQLREQVQNIE